jgi:hypothetical protein
MLLRRLHRMRYGRVSPPKDTRIPPRYQDRNQTQQEVEMEHSAEEEHSNILNAQCETSRNEHMQITNSLNTDSNVKEAINVQITDEEPENNGPPELEQNQLNQDLSNAITREENRLQNLRETTGALQLLLAELRRNYTDRRILQIYNIHNEDIMNPNFMTGPDQWAPRPLQVFEVNRENNEVGNNTFRPPQEEEEEEEREEEAEAEEAEAGEHDWFMKGHLELAPPGRQAPQERICCICLTDPACVLVVGCGTVCLCGVCAKRCQLSFPYCPHCRGGLVDETGNLVMQVVF